MSHLPITHPEHRRLLGRISDVYATGQLRAHQAVNVHITELELTLQLAEARARRDFMI